LLVFFSAFLNFVRHFFFSNHIKTRNQEKKNNVFF